MPWAVASHSDRSKTQVINHVERRPDICECQHPERITAAAKQLSMAWERADEPLNVEPLLVGQIAFRGRVPGVKKGLRRGLLVAAAAPHVRSYPSRGESVLRPDMPFRSPPFGLQEDAGS